MTRKFVVHNLPETATELELVEVFGAFGRVLSVVPTARAVGEASEKCFLVEMDPEVQVESILEMSGNGIDVELMP